MQRKRKPRIQSTLPNADVRYLSLYLPSFVVLVVSLILLDAMNEQHLSWGHFIVVMGKSARDCFGMSVCAELRAAWLDQMGTGKFDFFLESMSGNQ